jgi:hypothetical protein
MTNAFEYGDSLLPQHTDGKTGATEPQVIGQNQPYLNLATWVTLYDPIQSILHLLQIPDGRSS